MTNVLFLKYITNILVIVMLSVTLVYGLKINSLVNSRSLSNRSTFIYLNAEVRLLKTRFFQKKEKKQLEGCKKVLFNRCKII